MVADAAFGRRLVAVAGTHGKSTTAGWLVHALEAAGADPGAFVGALLPATLTGIGVPATARRGAGLPFVVEADEYAGNFDPYRPDVIVLTSAEWDHPDVFADRDAVLDTFEAWLRRATADRGPLAPPPVLVANVGDAGVAALVGRLGDWPGRLVPTLLVAADQDLDARAATATFHTRWPATVGIVGRITDAGRDGTVVEVATGPGDIHLGTMRLATAGRHNVSNALGVLGAGIAAGVRPDVMASGIATFTGVGRRLERKGAARGVVVYDDYGHHPTAIRETLAAVRQREPGRRLWAVYEPLTYHRTAAMLDAFAVALAAADAVAIADIWAGRDPDTTITSSAALARSVADRAPGKPVEASGSIEATAAWLATRVEDGDVVLVMGGGRSYRIGELLLDQLGA